MAYPRISRRRFSLATGLTLLAAGTGASAQAPAPEAGPYRFSPVNQYGINLTAAYWNPIIAYVTEKSGVKLQLKIGRPPRHNNPYVLDQ